MQTEQVDASQEQTDEPKAARSRTAPGAVMAEVTVFPDATRMAVVGRGNGIDGGMTSAEVFVHYSADGKLAVVKVWNGREWIVTKPVEEI